MQFEEHFLTHFDSKSNVDLTSRDVLNGPWKNEIQITKLENCKDEGFFLHEEGIAASRMADANLIFFKINDDCFLEVTESQVKWPTVCRSRIGDSISFQFVSSVSRSEILGDTRNVHSLGPAIICTAIPQSTMSYRVPQCGATVTYVVVHTTLSTLFRRLNESTDGYPSWLIDCVEGRTIDPVQRVYFSDTTHSNLVAPCFHPPVHGRLLPRWLTGKYWELLMVGLQSLKDNLHYRSDSRAYSSLSKGSLFRDARRILDLQYANPPRVTELARHLGLSETRLKSGFKAMFGVTIMQYCRQRRIDASKLLLAENDLSIARIASTVGYGDPSAFSRAFKCVTGRIPKDYRRSLGQYENGTLID